MKRTGTGKVREERSTGQGGRGGEHWLKDRSIEQREKIAKKIG